MPPKSSTAAPKTVLDKIEHAVRRMADPTGSSRQAIVKFSAEFNVDNATIKKALKTGVDSGRLVQKGQSFTLKGVEFKPPADEQVTIEVKVGDGAVAEVARGKETWGSGAGPGRGDEGKGFSNGKSCTDNKRSKLITQPRFLQNYQYDTVLRWDNVGPRGARVADRALFVSCSDRGRDASVSYK